MSHNFDARAAAASLAIGSVNASVVFLVSVLIGAPRQWPGAIFSLITTTCMAYFFLTRRRR